MSNDKMWVLMSQVDNQNPNFNKWEFENRPDLHIYKKKPPIEHLSSIVGINYKIAGDEDLLQLLKLHRGNTIAKFLNKEWLLREVGFYYVAENL